MKLSILYRGPLVSCNYGCEYCPFAKRKESAAEHAADEAALQRFVARIGELREHRFSILFTPWGEALIHPRYQRALVNLCAMPHVDRAAIQTNLSGRLDWVEPCDRGKLALWATFHPGETDLADFTARCHWLHERRVRFSVGVVGLREHLAAIESLRRALPADVYLWVNAYKRVPNYYTAAEREWITGIDPLFPFNAVAHASRGLACRTGHTVFSVKGDGVMRRCHFVEETIGNFYEADFTAALRPRPCPAERCGCHIGYVHLAPLGLDRAFGDGLLERIPQRASGMSMLDPRVSGVEEN
ncbi:MAG: radical SAM protein [Bryobacterales bacterium]|nr:radical SAM protein [Bryobacterales bacterium]